MERFIAVDSGKFATKVAEYKKNEDIVRTFSVRTKISEGFFCDDAIENNTVVVEINGKVYKVGNGAKGEGANLDTGKNDETTGSARSQPLQRLHPQKRKTSLM